MKNSFIFLLMLVHFQGIGNAGKGQIFSVKERKKIIIEIALPEGFNRNRIRLSSFPFDYAVRVTNDEGKPELTGNLMKCILYSDRPLLVDLRWIVGSNGMTYLCEPGDSIHIDFRKKTCIYSGNNVDKFIMQKEMHARERLLIPVKNPSFTRTNSIEDYLEWNHYLNTKLNIMDSVLALYKNRVTALAYNYLRADKIVDAEYERLMKFSVLVNNATYEEALGKQLGEIFDSTSCGKYAQWLHAYDGKVGKPHYFYNFIRRSIQRRYNFNLEHDSLKTAGRKRIYADLANYRLFRSLIPKRLALLERNKDSITTFAYTYIRSQYLSDLEKNLCNDFIDLCKYRQKAGLTTKALMNIWDSTIRVSAFHQMGLQESDTACLVAGLDGYFLHYAFFKQFAETNFEHIDKAWTGSSAEKLKFIYEHYHYIRQLYKGRAREITLSRCIETTIRQMGFSTELNAMVDDFLSLPGKGEYQQWIKNIVVSRQSNADGKSAPDFTVSGIDGVPIRLSGYRGKLVLVDMWFTGCVGCISMSNILMEVKKKFQNNPNIVFLNISTDTDKKQWLNSIAKGKYVSSAGVNAFTDGLGTRHPLIMDYDIKAYPAIFLIDVYGNFLNVQDPRTDQGKDLVKIVKRELASLYDGPYVLYKDNKLVAYSILPDQRGGQILKRSALPLTVVTNAYDHTFQLELQKKLQPENSTYSMPSKLLALSDLEGNFEALSKLLQANGVIDSAYKWIFGTGHLVCNGDFFDRGDQVTECLWLIYALEQQAREAGGYVHFILGNHEIMNLNNSLAYTRPKYISSAKLIGLNYGALWGKNSELGRWLRTKNIMEKIGDLLFVHGGISAQINRSGLSLLELNNLIRPVYDAEHQIRLTGSGEQVLLFRSRTSPFWYRGYYEKEYPGYDEPQKRVMASSSQVDSTLQKFKVNHIITGHTIVADTISSHYDGKIINIDTKHARGKSEALFIEGDYFYRVNQQGRRVLLFQEPKKP